MRALLLALLLLLTPGRAWGLSEPMAGWRLDLAGAFGADIGPVTLPFGCAVGAAWWFGKYDDTYALGRWASLGVVSRVERIGNNTRIAPMVEFRRGWDLMVVKPWFAIGLGTEHGVVAGVPIHLRIGGGVKYRMNRYLGLSARLDGGPVLLPGRVGARFGLLIGFDYSRPFHKPK